MYAKIQKDTTNIYILIESDEIELSNQTAPMPYSDYVRNFLPCLLDYDEEFNVRNHVGETLRYIFGCPDFPNTIAATTLSIGDCKCDEFVECSCAIKGVKVNGKYYVTCGAIYIMNDKGQTIQKI